VIPYAKMGLSSPNEVRSCAARREVIEGERRVNPPRSTTRRGDAMAEPINFVGNVDWSGENPGIALKEKPDGPFVALASFFRVVLSPHGRGHALVLLQSPQDANPLAERANICLHDN